MSINTLHKGDDDDDNNNNNNNKCSRESLVLTTQENNCLQVTLVNNFQLLSDSMDGITRFFIQSGEMTTEMTTKYRSAYRLRVTGACREIMPTDYRRSYVEGVEGLRTKTLGLCLKKRRKTYNMHKLVAFNSYKCNITTNCCSYFH
jgi:hypothetical protein